MFNLFLVFCFFTSGLLLPAPCIHADELVLPVLGTRLTTTPFFTPVLLRGLKVYPNQPLRFDFLVDSAEAALNPKELKKTSEKFAKYFLTALTIPEQDLWVNLSPYEKDRVIPQELGLTEAGQEMLTEDYILKQLAASLSYPEENLGKKFWNEVYQKAYAQYKTTDIPVNTFNKVWIVPGKAVVYQKNNTAFVMESSLKVMLEEDYLALSKSDRRGLINQTPTEINQLGSQITREILVPAIEKEVNEGKNFANLRQIYNAMILAMWYKKTLKNSLIAQVYSNQKKIAGINADDPKMKEKIYRQYVDSFKKGAYNFIKEDYDPRTRTILPRKYFSGGLGFENLDAAMTVQHDADISQLKKKGKYFVGEFYVESVDNAEISAGLEEKIRQMRHVLIQFRTEKNRLNKYALLNPELEKFSEILPELLRKDLRNFVRTQTPQTPVVNLTPLFSKWLEELIKLTLKSPETSPIRYDVYIMLHHLTMSLQKIPLHAQAQLFQVGEGSISNTNLALRTLLRGKKPKLTYVPDKMESLAKHLVVEVPDLDLNFKELQIYIFFLLYYTYSPSTEWKKIRESFLAARSVTGQVQSLSIGPISGKERQYYEALRRYFPVLAVSKKVKIPNPQKAVPAKKPLVDIPVERTPGFNPITKNVRNLNDLQKLYEEWTRYAISKKQILLDLTKRGADAVRLENGVNSLVKKVHYSYLAAIKKKTRESIDESSQMIKKAPEQLDLLIEVSKWDQALISNNKTTPEGGIDLNRNLNLQTREEKEIIFSFNPQEIEQIRAHGIAGLVPVVYKFIPVNNALSFLGFEP